MANHALTQHFASFFKKLNPSPSFEATAASEHKTIRGLIENPNGPAASLLPTCFLQGSYKQDTAIYTINDVDLVVLCRLWQGGEGTGGGRSYTRNEIFQIIAAPLVDDYRYRGKVVYGPTSMCIKVNLGIKVEILPVVYKSGIYDPQAEPFRLYRPETGLWEDGYAQYHQKQLTEKNAWLRTNGNFVPMIKVLKHLRSVFSSDAVSFHLECLLYNVPDQFFRGGPADYIPAVLGHIADTPAETSYSRICRTPCGERDIFTVSEWTAERWKNFHGLIALWAKSARLASNLIDRDGAIQMWQALLGNGFFLATVS